MKINELISILKAQPNQDMFVRIYCGADGIQVSIAEIRTEALEDEDAELTQEVENILVIVEEN